MDQTITVARPALVRDENPYLDELNAAWAQAAELHYDSGMFHARRRLAPLYAWAVPDQEAVDTLVALGPLVELGAGTGYWAALVSLAGGDVVAYDAAPPGEADNVYGHRHQWHPVHLGGPEKAAEHGDRALFLCWPPYDSPFALDSLLAYQGDTVAYVGEGRGGCTGDDLFHEELDAHWECTTTVQIPTWQGVYDRLEVYRRR